MEKRISEKKQNLINKALAENIKVGECISILGINCGAIRKENKYTFYVSEILDAERFSAYEADSKNNIKTLRFEHVIQRDIIRNIGANPFHEEKASVRFVAYTLDGILFKLGIGGGSREEKYHSSNGVLFKNVNFNPYVFDKEGNKCYYQRPLVWNLKDKQLFIDSLYNNIDCGKILVRMNEWEKLEDLALKGERNLAFAEVVDGKQRLHTLKEFFNNEFCDSLGNYYDDLSDRAQRKLTDNQLLAYGEMSGETTDDAVIEQFLKLNHSGVPQSEEHISFVKEIYKKL